MPSPFPGMNPYIEQDAFWQDFHLEFLPAIRARLVAQVVSEKWGQSVVIENKAGVTRPPPSHFQGGASWPRGGEDRQ